VNLVKGVGSRYFLFVYPDLDIEKYDNMRHMNLVDLNLNSGLHQITFNNHTDYQFNRHVIFSILAY